MLSGFRAGEDAFYKSITHGREIPVCIGTVREDGHYEILYRRCIDEQMYGSRALPFPDGHVIHDSACPENLRSPDELSDIIETGETRDDGLTENAAAPNQIQGISMSMS